MLAQKRFDKVITTLIRNGGRPVDAVSFPQRKQAELMFYPAQDPCGGAAAVNRASPGRGDGGITGQQSPAARRDQGNLLTGRETSPDV